MKQLVLNGLTHRSIRPLWRPFLRGASAIYMLHRFADPERGIGAHAHLPEQVRGYLAFLRREKYRIVSLASLLDMLDTGEAVERTVAFTVDDGYDDFLNVGLPIFAEFDVPATLFAVTGFIDRQCWMWWDRIEYALRTTKRTSVTLGIGGARVSHRFAAIHERVMSAAALADRLKTVDDDEKNDAVEALAHELEVEIPREAPMWCAPMSWDDIRTCVARGMGVGPHTVTHPILARVDDERAKTEIRESWNRLRQEVPNALPVFCYPNGDPGSFTARDMDIVRALGLRAAVSTLQEYATSSVLEVDERSPEIAGRYTIPRFTYPPSQAHLVQVVSGLERAKETLRRLLPRSRRGVREPRWL
ncbi:MAG: polysaccharide deacetylase family protein [Gemmatimonadaceae bacterium]